MFVEELAAVAAIETSYTRNAERLQLGTPPENSTNDGNIDDE